jgi:AcrR family transcriptional regulator
MARIVKEEEYDAKRNEILDVARGLIYTKGYELMTIQDILDGLRISRGAFYHYFDSKQALLEALIDRMGTEADQLLLPIVQDPDLFAIEKFRRYFESGARWKNTQKPLIMSLMRMWYTDENAIIRQKMTEVSLKHTARLLEPIIRQGIEEDVFTTRYPEQVAVIVAGIGLSLTDSIVALVLAPKDENAMEKLTIILEAYADTLERILGAPPVSLKIFEPEVFSEWLGAVQPEPLAKKPAGKSVRR